MRYLAITLGLLILFASSACRGDVPDAGNSSLTQSVAIPTNIILATPSLTSWASLTPAASSPVSPAPTLIAVTPIPSPSPDLTASRSEVAISPENASRLSPANEHFFDPWTQVLAVAWSPDGESVAVAAGDHIYLLEAHTLEVKQVLEPGVASPGLAFSPDGSWLAGGDRNGVLRIWDMSGGQLLLEWQAHQKSISSLVFSPDGRLLATAGYDAVARLWDASSAANLGEMIGGSYAIPAIAFTPDGNNLAIVNGNVIRLREVETTRFVRTLVGDASFYTIAAAPDGQYLASGDVDNTVRIWDLSAEAGPGGEIRSSLYTLSGHSGRTNRPEALIWQVAYSPDGSLLASAGGDGKLLLWETDSGKALAALSGHTQAVTSTAFSPDGRWLASGGLDGRLILWGVLPAGALSAPEQDQDVP